MTIARRAHTPMTDRERSRARSVISGVLAENGVTNVSRTLGFTTQNIYRWVRDGWMTDERALTFSHRFKIDLSDLRPDLWGRKW